MIRIVTDSASQLDAGWAQQHGVVVLPHHIKLDGKEYREGVDLDAEALAAKMSTAKQVSIHGPTVQDFDQAYRRLADEKADVISLHVSSSLSDTLQNAVKARAEYRGRCNIHVVDSRCVSLGLHELVQATHAFTQQRISLDDVVQRVRGLIPHIYGIFVSDDMKALEHSARLRPAQAELGKMLGIIPCLSLEEGDIVAVEKVRNSEKAVERLAEFAGEFDEFERLAILQLNPDLHEQIEQLIEAIQPLFPDMAQIPIETCGPIIGNIIGASGYGVMIYEGERGLR
jgi:DegV family protein with EDD domain